MPRRILGHILPRAGLALLFLAGCASHIGTTSKSFLRRVQESPDPNVRYLAYDKLASPRCYDSEEQKVEAARVLAGKLSEGTEPVASRAVICRTLGELKRPEGREAVLAAINDPEPLIRAEACRAIGKLGHPEDASHLTRIMSADSDSDCRIAAIEGLGELKATDPRVAVLLAEGMEHDDPAVRLASLRSLRAISGEDLGTDPKAWKELAKRLEESSQKTVVR